MNSLRARQKAWYTIKYTQTTLSCLHTMKSSTLCKLDQIVSPGVDKTQAAGERGVDFVLTTKHFLMFAFCWLLNLLEIIKRLNPLFHLDECRFLQFFKPQCLHVKQQYRESAEILTRLDVKQLKQ